MFIVIKTTSIPQELALTKGTAERASAAIAIDENDILENAIPISMGIQWEIDK